MKIAKFSRVLAAVTTAFAALILSACTLSLDPVNALVDAFRFADTNVGTLKVVNAAENGTILYGIQVILPDKILNEYQFESGLLPGNSREYRLPAQITYNVSFSNGKGWTKIPLTAFFTKDETFTVTFTGTEEISIDLSGIKGKLTVYNSIPATEGDYVIEDLRVSSTEGTDGQESIVFYFHIEQGIHNGGKPDFDVLPGDYWVRAQIREPKTGKLSKWSIPAHVGSYNAKNKDQFDVSAEPGKITVSADRGGIAVFNEKVLKGGQAGGEVDTGYNAENNPGGNANFPSIPDNDLLNGNGEKTPNISGSIDPDSRPVKSIKVEKLGFPTADRNGVTVDPKYAYTSADIDTVVREGKTVKTTIYDQSVTAKDTWQLSLTESGWYLLSFSVDGKTFSKAFPVRLEDKNGNGKIDPDEMEPGVIPPYNENDSTWTDKQGVVVKNNTPSEGGPIYKLDSGGKWVEDKDKNGSPKILSPADAQKPITDIKVYSPGGSLHKHYRSQQGLPIYNGKEWIITPGLPSGDYMIILTDDNGATWTYPPFPFHVDGNGDGKISYDKTHPFWDRTTAAKPAPELTSPSNPDWNDPTGNWKPGTEINPKNPIYVVIPSEPPLDTIPPGTGPKELADAEDPKGDGSYDGTPPAPGSQLDIINKEKGSVINFIKLNSFATPNRAYRIIDLRKITYSGGNPPVKQTGGLPAGRRLSLAGFDFKPDLYYVYLSENGKTWWKYHVAVNIYAPWTTNARGEIVPISAGKVEKVIYRNNDADWDKPEKPPVGDGDGQGEFPGSGNSGSGDNNNDGGGVKTGILIVQNPRPAFLSSITIKRPSSNGAILEYAGVKYENYPLNVPGTSAKPAGIKSQAFVLPVTTEDTDKISFDSHYASNLRNSYPVKVVGYLSANKIGECYYRVTIAPGKITYIAFSYGHLAPDGNLYQGVNTETSPWALDPFDPPGDALFNSSGSGSGNSGGSDSQPPSFTEEEKKNNAVISGGGGSWGLMQPGSDPVGLPNDAERNSNLFDRSYSSPGDRSYPTGQVQPYLPNPSVAVPYPAGGDGTKKNMYKDGSDRGYFNFRFDWYHDSNWGIGYLAIQKLQRRGTSSIKDPEGPIIVLLDAKAPMERTDLMISGSAQRDLGMIYKDYENRVNGSIKGEDRSFNSWQANWLGLRDSATGWQLNVRPDGRLDPTQPVYRAGKGYYPTDTNAAWETDKSDKPATREFSAHRALNNPGRLYTTGVILNADGTHNRLYAPMGTGFEAGEYRVYLYKGYDSLDTSSSYAEYNQPNRQKKMYRRNEAEFDITIYPGVVTTALYRAGLDRAGTEGAFAYTPIPQAAFGKIVVLNNPPNNDYTITAILLDKPGYQNKVNSSAMHEVHRYIAALASTPSSMRGGTPNLLNNNSWGAMNPLRKGEMYTFILPPGGYRIAVQSTRDRDSSHNWYGEGSGTWLPVVVTEGETVYLSYRGDELSR
jgi:hypothetical protein